MIKRFLETITHVFTVALLPLAIASCGSQSNPPEGSHGHEALILVGNDENGLVSVIEHGGDQGDVVIKTIPVGSGDIGGMVATTEGHVFVSVTANNSVAAIDPVVEGAPELRNFLPVGTRPVHIYRDPEGTRVWVMNDGDATSGPCKTAGPAGTATSSVTVIQNHEVGEEGSGGGAGILGEVIATICVGRGHHKTAFSEPSNDHPDVPHRVFVSNITDGTISVIDNDPTSSEYLKVVAIIDLCDSVKEQALGKPACDGDPTTSNSATPHGIDHSSFSGKIYNANVGYGTVAVIDPLTNAIEATIDIGFSNKAHVSPDGQFLVVKGTDKTSDHDHVYGKITVIDVTGVTTDTCNASAGIFETCKQFDLVDIHPDHFEFTPDGSKLYVTSATTGSNTQKGNIRNTVILVFDTSALPEIALLKEITVGAANGGHRALAIHEHDGMAEHVFVPNPADGTISVIDAERDEVEDTVYVGGEPSSIMVFPIEGGHSH